MAESTAERLHRRFIEALNTRDWDLMAEVTHPDFVTEWPQSGERIRGADNLRQIFTHYPDSEGLLGPADETADVFDASERWIVTPMYTAIRVTGGGNRYTGTARARYPNGEVWYVISLVEVRDERMFHSTTYFAPIYPAPEWRAEWVEAIPEP